MRYSSTDLRNLILLGAAAVAAGLLAPGLPYVGLPLAAFALCWITYRFGIGASLVTTAFATLLVVLVGPALGLARVQDALYVGVTLLLVGPGTAVALRRFPALAVLGGLTLTLTALFLASPVGSQTLADTVVLLRQFLAGGVLSAAGSSATAIKRESAAVITQFGATWPSTVYYMMGLSALLVVPSAMRAAKAQGIEIHRYPHLADVDVSFHIVWPTIAGIAALAAGTFAKQPMLGAVGTNVLMFVRPVLVLQGLADFSALYRRANAGRFAKGIGYVLLLATELIVPSVSILGLVDVFFNLRRRPRGGTTAVAGTART